MSSRQPHNALPLAANVIFWRSPAYYVKFKSADKPARRRRDFAPSHQPAQEHSSDLALLSTTCP
eukprot:4553581-Pyramimonas_sp.AAC.1